MTHCLHRQHQQASTPHQARLPTPSIQLRTHLHYHLHYHLLHQLLHQRHICQQTFTVKQIQLPYISGMMPRGYPGLAKHLDAACSRGTCSRGRSKSRQSRRTGLPARRRSVCNSANRTECPECTEPPVAGSSLHGRHCCHSHGCSRCASCMCKLGIPPLGGSSTSSVHALSPTGSWPRGKFGFTHI